MATFSEIGWSDIEDLRGQIGLKTGTSVEEVAQGFTESFAHKFESLILARLFLVLPFEKLSAADQALAFAQMPNVKSRTQILTLLATQGCEVDWNDRTKSRGHRVIPLIDAASVSQAPMIATLLASLGVDLVGLDEDRPIVTRALLGGANSLFYVPDANTAKDANGRYIIPARDFVQKYRIQTVFGMGGAYLNGTIAVAIFFTNEKLDINHVNRFPTFIGNFKISSAQLLAAGKLYRPAS